MTYEDWPFRFFTAGFGPRAWSWRWPGDDLPRDRGEALKLAILRLLRERSRAGHEILAALKERLGERAPSAASVYPTLQLLEDLGYVRVAESEGRRVYHLTPAGDAYLAEHREGPEDGFEWLHDALGELMGGSLAELGQAIARVAAVAYRQAWRAEEATVKAIVDILRRAAEDIARLR